MTPPITIDPSRLPVGFRSALDQHQTTGGDLWFGGETLMNLLSQEGIASIRTDQGSILQPDRLAKTDLLVFYCEGRWDGDEPASRRLTPDQEEALVQYVEGGGTGKEDFLPIGVACRVIPRMQMPNDTIQVVFS